MMSCPRLPRHIALLTSALLCAALLAASPAMARDRTAPTAPSSLSASGTSASSIALAWAQSTDNVGVSSYLVYRNGSTTAIATVSAATVIYVDNGLASSTTYSYVVKAKDRSGNLSKASNQATATTMSAPDTTPPTAPTALSATAASSSQINLNWAASVDNAGGSGVASYQVLRNSMVIATLASGTLAYADTGLAAATTYTYTVSALDRAGNQSPASSSLSATTVSPSSAPSYMFINASELAAKPMSGTGWTFVKNTADLSSWGTVNLADQESVTQTKVLAGALVYARTGNTVYRDKVISYVQKVCGTQTDGTDQLLNLARTLYGYVVAADLVGMPMSTVCTNGQTWDTFLRSIRDYTIPGNSRWPTLTITSANTSSNWGAYALASHLAVSYALNDSVAIQRDTDIFKRVLGDTTSPARPFQPTAGYLYNSNGATWDMSPTMQRGINPYSATDVRSGALVEDVLRYTSGGSDSIACCTVQAAAVSYQEETLDGMLSTAQLLRAHGVDLTTFQDGAMQRAFNFYITHGGPSQYSVPGYLPYVINYLYGTHYSTTLKADSIYRHMGYGGWLFTGTR